jgi:hypothetical protein
MSKIHSGNTMTYPTRAELEAQGLKLRGTYTGPLTLEYAKGILADFQAKTFADGSPTFPNVQIVSQDTGYNVVYTEESAPEWHPTGNARLDPLINCFGNKEIDTSDRGTTIYRGFTLSEFLNISNLESSFHEVDSWADGFYRRVWLSDELKACFSYCEGDTSIEIAADDSQYRKMIWSAHSFYCGREGKDTELPQALTIAAEALGLYSNPSPANN